jgi:hypothetical protein
MANEFKVKKGLIVDGSGGTILDVQGSVGQLFSVTDSLTGDLFAVSDISGIPILNVNSSGAVDIDGTLNLGDSDKIQIGASQDLQIFHNGSNSYIETSSTSVGDFFITARGTNHDLYLEAADNIYIRPQGNENGVVVVGNGGVTLYYNNSAKLETTNTGVTVTGEITATTGRFTSAGDASITSTTHAFQSGVTGSTNIIIDNNEIMARNNGAVSTLNINPDGGTVTFHNNGTGSQITSSGDATFAGNIGATNFSGSSSGTNTGDQTLPTLSSLGALSTSGGTMTGHLTLSNTSAPLDFAELNIGYSGTGETRAIDVHGNWSGNESKSITFTHGSTATNIVGQINCQHNGPGSRLRWGKLYHSGDSSTYTMELVSTSATTANLTVTGNISATNFSGSSSGTNTGDQTLPTLSSLGALSTTGKAADSNLLDGIDSSGFTRKYTFSPGSSGGSRRYIKLFTLDDFDDGVTGILSAAGDYGDADKASYQIQIGTRTGISFDVYQTSHSTVSDDYEFYYRQIENNDYEIWVLTSDYNQNNQFTVLSQFGTVTYNFDSATTTEPTGLNQVTKHTIYHTGNLSPLTIGTTATTALAGNTSLLAIGTTSTTAMAGDTAIPTLASLGALSTTAKAADSELLDGVDSTRFVYGGNSTKTTNISSFSTALNSGFFDSNSATGSPTATWYTLLNMRHNNTSNNYGSQLAVSFYSNADMYVRTINNGTYAGWSKVYNEANLTPLTIGTTATTAMAGNTTIPSGNAVIDWTVDNDNIVIHSGNYTDTDTWVANSATAAGYVASGANQVNKVWKTDASGNPGWADDRDTDTVYTHPTSAGNKHIPTGGSAGQFLKYSASGTATWAVPSYTTNTNTTYSAGTGLDLTGTTFSVEPDLRDGITYVGKDSSNYIQFDSTNGRIDFYAGGAFVARMEAEGDLHIKGDVIAFSNIFS